MEKSLKKGVPSKTLLWCETATGLSPALVRELRLELVLDNMADDIDKALHCDRDDARAYFARAKMYADEAAFPFAQDGCPSPIGASFRTGYYGGMSMLASLMVANRDYLGVSGIWDVAQIAWTARGLAKHRPPMARVPRNTPFQVAFAHCQEKLDKGSYMR